jgi:hypothetical protein
MRLIVVFMFVLSFGSAAQAAQSCEEWFRGLKLTVGSKECELQCAMTKTDMASFDCPSRCEEFCRRNSNPKCQLDSFWKKRLVAKGEPFANLNILDRQIVERALSKMPKSFRPAKLKAIVKASGTGSILTGYSPAVSSDEYIILFPSAFAKSEEVSRIMAHEITHFLIANEWASHFKRYKQASGWETEGRVVEERKGGFVATDGRSSPEEDFANNIEFYLFERSKLKVQSPEIFKWIDNTLANLLKMEKGCSDVE